MGAVQGFARAGLAGTVEGERLEFLMNRLSREVANLFIPAISSATKALEGLVSKFQHLSNAQQNAIGKSVLIAGGMMGAVRAISAMGFAVNPAVGALTALAGGMLVAVSATEKGAEAFARLEESWGRFAEAAAPAAKGAINAIADSLNNVGEYMEVINRYANLSKKELGDINKMLRDSGRKEITAWQAAVWATDINSENQKKSSTTDHKQLTQSGGGLESSRQTYQRIQAAALKGSGPDHSAQTAQNTKDIADKQDQVIAAIDRNNPTVT